jgi:hypothetical protein
MDVASVPDTGKEKVKGSRGVVAEDGVRADTGSDALPGFAARVAEVLLVVLFVVSSSRLPGLSWVSRRGVAGSCFVW